METTTELKNEQTNPLKKWVITLAILAIVFFATTLYFGFFAKPVFNTQYVEATTEKENLQTELDSLLASHDKIKAEYGELSEQLSEKDSTIIANAEEIKKLINSQADYKKIKKQLARLQTIAKEYVDEMDKLYQENLALKQENTQVKESLVQEKEKSATYRAKITTAAVFKAYNIYSRAVYYKSRNSSEVITEKASRAKKFKTSLILGENSLIEPGPVNIYCRIAVPETGRVLSPGASDAYTFNNNGQQLQYTAKTTINYTKKAENVTLFWDVRDGDKVAKGKYIVEIFSDSGFLGETSFELD